MIINKQSIPKTLRDHGRNATDMLANEIHGLASRYFRIPPSDIVEYAGADDCSIILIFLNGKGIISSGKVEKRIEQLSIAAIPPSLPFHVRTGNHNLEYIELIWKMNQADLLTIENSRQDYYFRNYVDCPPYKEAIKSEKTISRTLIPENIIPRMCMGSVQTEGPDEVAPHTHPMLEQLFWGLAGNNCIVRADDLKTEFIEDQLLHIPLGSKHGVKVEPGRKLNYLWMDFFADLDGMSYIAETHRAFEKNT